MNGTIDYYAKDVYGNEMLYVADEKLANIITNLTGRKTLTPSDISALKALGFELNEVPRPRSN